MKDIQTTPARSLDLTYRRPKQLQSKTLKLSTKNLNAVFNSVSDDFSPIDSIPTSEVIDTNLETKIATKILLETNQFTPSESVEVSSLTDLSSNSTATSLDEHVDPLFQHGEPNIMIAIRKEIDLRFKLIDKISHTRMHIRILLYSFLLWILVVSMTLFVLSRGPEDYDGLVPT